MKCKVSRSLHLKFSIYRREGGASRPCGRATRPEGRRWFHSITQKDQVSAVIKFHAIYVHLSSVGAEVSKLTSVLPPLDPRSDQVWESRLLLARVVVAQFVDLCSVLRLPCIPWPVLVQIDSSFPAVRTKLQRSHEVMLPLDSCTCQLFRHEGNSKPRSSRTTRA